jgi:LmbE family N-acetylglucosaminyl deacetylase
LVVLAHPDDEAFAVGGTLGRWADAGVDIHLACATAGEAGRATEGETPSTVAARRTNELYRSAEILGVRHVHLLGFPDGGLDAGDPKGVASIRELMDELQPDVCVTFGADGVTGHPDHVAVHHWVRAARPERATLFYIAYPKDVATRLGVVGCSSAELSARIDVRPWADLKRESIEAHRSERSPFDLDDPAARVIFSREWYAGDTPVEVLKPDLFKPTNGA